MPLFLLAGMMSRLTSLRARTLAVVCAVVVIPVLFVWASSPVEDAFGYQMRQDVLRSTLDAGSLVKMDAPTGEFMDLADNYDVWIRSIDLDGKTLAEANGKKPPGIRDWLLFVPNPVPTLEEWDGTQPPVEERPLVEEVMRTGVPHGECFVTLGDTLMVCAHARRFDMAGIMEPRVVYAVTASPRVITALYDDRYQVMKLTMLVLVIAIGLGLWLGWRIGRPLDRLREEVLERTAPHVSTMPIEVVGDDEFAELARAFNSLLEALETRNQANEAFMADMAHEVKNPVAAIRAAAESLEGRELTEQRAARISRILRDSSKRLDAVVNNFLELARAESGLSRDERTELRVDELVENLVNSYANDPRFESITLEVKVERALVDAAAEPLESAIRNLIQNAASFADSRVDVMVSREGEEVIIEVIDDGPGINPEDHERVFDRFFTRRDDGGGTGLGLAMVRAIAHAHGGTVTIASTTGQGATFTIRLPALSALG